MQVNAIIQENGRPLRGVYVEHIVVGFGTGMYITNNEGEIENIKTDKGIESLGANADIRVICQNKILRVVDGSAANLGVYQDRSITDGDIINLDSAGEQRRHYQILNLAQITYEVAFEPLSFFRNQPRSDFPLGRKSSLRDTRDQPQRIELSFPDDFPNRSSFVEPRRLIDNFPLIHIKPRTNAFDAGRLFGDDGASPTLIPAELSHALHFSCLSEANRVIAQDKYLQFLITTGGLPHAFGVRTSPEVAFIEALDHFSTNFTEFVRARQGGAFLVAETITPEIQTAFVEAEWQRVVTSRFSGLLSPLTFLFRALGRRNWDTTPWIPGLVRGFFTLSDRWTYLPTATGGDVEGAVYSAIFVDFARTVGLDFAASTYFKSGALTYGDYHIFIDDHHPDKLEILQTVREFWGL